MKILITGGSGFIGRNLAEQFACGTMFPRHLALNWICWMPKPSANTWRAANSTW